jgi:protein phosphatase PTC6
MEALRIYASGGTILEDSYGELRVMGRLAVTRTIGDKGLKDGIGVLSEPQITRFELFGKDVAFALMVTDGLTSVFSDQEMVDMVKLVLYTALHEFIQFLGKTLS